MKLRVGQRNLVCWIGVGLAVLFAAAGASAQQSPAERGHGLTVEDAAAGWISLFDGATTLGWSGASVRDGRLTGGTTTTELGDCELRADVEHEGTIEAGGKAIPVAAGPVTVPSTGRRGPVRLGPGVVLRSLAARPVGLKVLFSGRSLDGCVAVNPPKAQPGALAPTWTLAGGRLHARGGPGAMELPGRYGDFHLRVEAITHGRSNGGVFFRNPPGTCMMGYEAQVYNRAEDDDPARPAVYATGAIDDRQNARRLISRDSVPFVMTVVAHGPHIATWVNGAQVTDWTDTRPRHETPRRGLRTEAGTIQLQAHDPETDVEFGPIAIGPIE